MQILSSETLLSVPVEFERSPNTAVFIACVAGAGYFFLRPEKTGARFVGYRVWICLLKSCSGLQRVHASFSF